MKKRIGLIVIAIVVITIAIFTLVGKQGLLSLYENHGQYRHLSVELEKSQKIIDSLKTEIVRLRTDTSYIEKIARERLGMARKNEKVYKFIEE
jgi:cell division protein FtsB